MKLKTVTKQSEMNILKGCQIDFTEVDGQIRDITLTDEDGAFIRISRGESYMCDLKVSIKAPPKMKTIWAVTGNLDGITVHDEFEHKHEAESRLQDLAYKINTEDGEFNNAFSVREFEVEDEA